MEDQDTTIEAAAAALSVTPFERRPDRPMAHVLWAKPRDTDAGPDAGPNVALYVAMIDAPAGERERLLAAAQRIADLAPSPAGVQRTRKISLATHAYTADLWTMGCVNDLPALGWPVRRRLEFVRDVAKALEGLHAAGIVHGCLCEENVLLDDDLRPVVAEAGAASVRALVERGGDATSYAAFAAPEVLEGAEPTVRSDVYSLGRLLQSVFRADDLPQVSELSKRCRAPAAIGRFASAAAVAGAIDGLIATLAPEPVGPTPQTKPQTKPRAEAKPALEVAAAAEQPREEAAPPPASPRAWPAPLGLGVAVGSLVLAALGAGSSATVREVLTVLLVGGVLVASASLRLRPAPMPALRSTLAVALAALVAVTDPLSLAYRAAAQRAIRASPASCRAAVDQIMRLGGDFQGLSLAKAILPGTDLRGADLRGVDLSGADLSDTNLFGASLQGVNLGEANVAGSDLRLSDLGHAGNVESAHCNAKTELPPSFRCVAGQLKEQVAPIDGAGHEPPGVGLDGGALQRPDADVP